MRQIPQSRLKKAMQALARNAKPFTGFCFRCMKPKYGNIRDAFSGEGSL